MSAWFLPKVTEYWDTQTDAIPRMTDRLRALSELASSDAQREISESIAKHVDVLPDDLLLRAAVCAVEDLYRAGAHLPMWDAACTDYVWASAGAFFRLFSERGFSLHYVVDNSWPSLDYPFILYPRMLEAAGFVNVCPQLIARELIVADGHDPERCAFYDSEARHVAAQLISKVHSAQRHLALLELADTEQRAPTIQAALRSAGEPGVLGLLRTEPHTSIKMWFPKAKRPDAD